MKRRQTIALLGGTAVAWSLAAAAQAQKRLPHIAYLWQGSAGSDGETHKGLQAGLGEFGYREGRNLVVDYRYADGSEGRLAELAAAVIAARPDVIVTPGTIVTGAVAKLTRTIPIASVTGDPVGSGFAASLARPGGNVTGMAITAGPELAEKWLELLSELVPRARRIAMLRHALNTSSLPQLSRMRAVAERRANGLTIDEYPIREAAELPSAFEAIRQARMDALVVDNNPLFASKRAEIAALGLPAITGGREFVEAGLLAGYGANIFDVFRRTGSYIDRILKGAQPADLPIEQPTKFDLLVNLKTARALGLTLPPSILARADEVIE